MTPSDVDDEKPAVLKKPRSLIRFLMALLALFAVVYVAIAAMAFFRTQSNDTSTPPSAQAPQEKPNV
ncbi:MULTISPECIES: hypothetical protein [unclassified Brevundimonas]|uniref:hypothetical protein n=1 Tax=unclassified Brevundimonas TaxID=2622653 RepID=UPI0025C06307|nr:MULTISPECIES: hypothetical protein [unclassified Brevundimonas]